MLDLKAVEERPEGLVHGPPQAMSVPHLQLTFAVQTIAVFGSGLHIYHFFIFSLYFFSLPRYLCLSTMQLYVST
jgi:hypothetical protein